MKILNFGSLNIDKTYEVSRIVKEGETISSLKHETFLGGKGLNQSIALSRAGGKVFHAGKVGNDGLILINALKDAGVVTKYILETNKSSGHAIIQIDKDGSNAIIVDGGTNKTITKEEIDLVLKNFGHEDWILLQNEISNLSYLIQKAKETGMKVALNASPIDENLLNINLNLVDLLFINEIEGYELTKQKDKDRIVKTLVSKNTNLKVVLTLGTNGSLYYDQNVYAFHEAIKVEAVDTTGAGDTYTGYFLANFVKGVDVNTCLKLATKASAISVTRKGAANSIPYQEEVNNF